MAIVKIEPTKLSDYNKASREVDTDTLTVAIDGTDGAYYEHKERDDRYLIIAQNTDDTDSKNLTILKGNGIQGVADEIITIGAEKTIYITLESGRFKNVYGANKGKVMFSGDADIKLAVIKLP